MSASAIGLDDWIEWMGGPRPVPAATRVEVQQAGGRWARGVAVAFNWSGSGQDVVLFWRLAQQGMERR